MRINGNILDFLLVFVGDAVSFYIILKSSLRCEKSCAAWKYRGHTRFYSAHIFTS